jgi:hypothetical protein
MNWLLKALWVCPRVMARKRPPSRPHPVSWLRASLHILRRKIQQFQPGQMDHYSPLSQACCRPPHRARAGEMRVFKHHAHTGSTPEIRRGIGTQLLSPRRRPRPAGHAYPHHRHRPAARHDHSPRTSNDRNKSWRRHWRQTPGHGMQKTNTGGRGLDQSLY